MSGEPLAGLPACELREWRRDGSRWVAYCHAALADLGDTDAQGERVWQRCGTCPVPGALEDRWVCLHLRPTVLAGQAWDPRLPCRWFFKLRLGDQPRSLGEQCHGCPYWFPRPRFSVIPRHDDEVAAIQLAERYPERVRARFSFGSRPPVRLPWWRRVLRPARGARPPSEATATGESPAP